LLFSIGDAPSCEICGTELKEEDDFNPNLGWFCPSCVRKSKKRKGN